MHVDDDLAVRERVLREFHDGAVRVLCACDILNEGWDCPDVEVLLMARPTLSKVIYLQQLGRGTRKAPGKGVKTGARRPSSSRPSQWAAARLEQPTRTTLLTPVPLPHDALTPAVTLDRPVKLPTAEQARSTRLSCETVRPHH